MSAKGLKETLAKKYIKIKTIAYLVKRLKKNLNILRNKPYDTAHRGGLCVCVCALYYHPGTLYIMNID